MLSHLRAQISARILLCMKSTRPALSVSQNAYAAAKSACDLAWIAYQAACAANEGEDADDAERATWTAWAAAKATLRTAERAMVAEMTGKLKAHRAASGHAETIDYVAANATGKDWERVVDLCFRAA